MKLKIIIFPFVIIMAIILSVNFIYPDYQKIKASMNEIKNREEVLKDLEEKSQNVKKLISNLETNSNYMDFVMNYLPEKKNEEKIIDRSNYLTIDSSTLLANVDLEKPLEPVVEKVSADEKAIAERNAIFAGDPNKIQVQPEPPVKVSYIGSTIELIGTYANIKNYLNRLYRIENWFDVNSLLIEPSISDNNNNNNTTTVGVNQATNNQGSNEVKNLVVKYDLNFGYLPKTNIKINQIPQIFSETEFDFSPAEKAIEICTSSVPEMDVGSFGGRIDPFFP